MRGKEQTEVESDDEDMTPNKTSRNDDIIRKMMTSIASRKIDPFDCVRAIVDSQPLPISILESSPSLSIAGNASSLPDSMIESSRSLSIAGNESSALMPSSLSIASEQSSLIIATNKSLPNVTLESLNEEVASLKTLVTSQSQMLAEMKAEWSLEVAKQITKALENHNCQQLLKEVLDAVALVNAKCETIGQTSAAQTSSDRSTTPSIQRMPNVLVKAMSVDDLVQLNEQAKDPKFVDAIIAEKGTIYGPNTMRGLGRTVLLNMVDHFVARSVFVDCCWTGVGKNGPKIAFKELTHFLKMMYELGRYSDPDCTLIDVNKLFQFTIISTALKRSKAPEIPLAKPAQRTRVSSPSYSPVAKKRREYGASASASTSTTPTPSQNSQLITAECEPINIEIREIINDGDQQIAILSNCERVAIVTENNFQ